MAMWDEILQSCDRFSLVSHEDWIVEQFTGLTDKNGKEIYEGDLLRLLAKDEWDKINYSAFEVFFHDGDMAGHHIGFKMDRMYNFGSIGGGSIPNFLPKNTAKMEIIGNIHENKELLTRIK